MKYPKIFLIALLATSSMTMTPALAMDEENQSDSSSFRSHPSRPGDSENAEEPVIANSVGSPSALPDSNQLFEMGEEYRYYYSADCSARWFGGWEKNYALSAYYYARAAKLARDAGRRHEAAENKLQHVWEEENCWGRHITRAVQNLPNPNGTLEENLEALIGLNSYAPLDERASLGYPEAQFSLGIAHGRGTGVPMNMDEALRWLQRAADQRHVQASTQLGMMYAIGMGVE